MTFTHQYQSNHLKFTRWWCCVYSTYSAACGGRWSEKWTRIWGPYWPNFL